MYQTLPGVQVPAHLYVPEGINSPAPAILFYPGHWWPDSKTRPDFQAFCINAARLGFVVLSFDPFGQGERGISSRDHRRTEALLVGVAQQGIAEYETQCALEYLLTRKEVDQQRIGMTGASGGGYNTWMTAALDPRIKVAVPVVGTSEFYQQLHVCRPLDWYQAREHCHFVPRLIQYANNHELLALVAPRPLMVISASEDQSFPPESVREIVAYGRELYRTCGAAERLGFFEDTQDSHGYQKRKREASYGWFRRWLMNMGDGSAYPEPPTETLPYDSPELRCFPVGQNQAAGPGIMAAVQKLASQIAPSPTLPPLEPVLGILPKTSNSQVRITPELIQRLEFASEKGLAIPAFLLKTSQEEKGILIAVDDRGKESLVSDPFIQAALANGWSICGVDPRGIGELTTSKPGWVFAVSLLLGNYFPWLQAWDVNCVVNTLHASEAYAQKHMGLYARGHDAAMAATFALAQISGRKPIPLQWFVFREGFLSFRQFLNRPASLPQSCQLKDEEEKVPGVFDREIPHQYFLFNGLRYFDLPQLMAWSGIKGMVVNPLDGDWKRMGAAEAQKLLPSSIQIISEEDPTTALRAFLQGR